MDSWKLQNSVSKWNNFLPITSSSLWSYFIYASNTFTLPSVCRRPYAPQKITFSNSIKPSHPPQGSAITASFAKKKKKMKFEQPLMKMYMYAIYVGLPIIASPFSPEHCLSNFSTTLRRDDTFIIYGQGALCGGGNFHANNITSK